MTVTRGGRREGAVSYGGWKYSSQLYACVRFVKSPAFSNYALMVCVLCWMYVTFK